MPVCTYDNPDTMQRECWSGGKLYCAYSAELLLSKPPPWDTQPVPREYFFFGANIGHWKCGQLVGDRDAILRVSGDFADDEQRVAYAKEIARRLNLTVSAGGQLE